MVSNRNKILKNDSSLQYKNGKPESLPLIAAKIP